MIITGMELTGNSYDYWNYGIFYEKSVVSEITRIDYRISLVYHA